MPHRRSPHDPTIDAPGASSSGFRMPGSGDRLPRIDDHIAPPETRVEYLGGVEIFAAPAKAPHATQHGELAYVLRAHAKPGYRTAVDMLTRTGDASDFAPDASVFPEAPDPLTHGRRLEELAFEVSDQQALSVPTRKARELAARGVRRVFCILVKPRRVLEWSRRTDGWETLAHDAFIEDPVLVRPLPLKALLSAAQGDDAVARALLEKRTPALEEALASSKEEGREAGKEEGRAEGKEEGRAEGKEEGRAEGTAKGVVEATRANILAVLRERGIHVPPDVASRIATCGDASALSRWLSRAVTAKTAREVLRVTGRRKR